MEAHRVETIIQSGGTLAVHGLPVADGALVEVIVLVKEPRKKVYPLRGTAYRLEDPTEPAVRATDWEAER
jgi:hypothetical protein